MPDPLLQVVDQLLWALFVPMQDRSTHLCEPLSIASFRLPCCKSTPRKKSGSTRKVDRRRNALMCLFDLVCEAHGGTLRAGFAKRCQELLNTLSPGNSPCSNHLRRDIAIRVNVLAKWASGACVNTLLKQKLSTEGHPWPQWGYLTPQSLDLPLPCVRLPPMEAIESFLHWFNDRPQEHNYNPEKRINDEYFAKHLRILQWEVGLRDVVEEARQEKAVYKMATELLRERGRRVSSFASEAFHASLATAAWFEEAREQASKSKRGPHSRYNDEGVRPRLDSVYTKLRTARQGFMTILPRVRNLSPHAYQDIIETFAHRHKDLRGIELISEASWNPLWTTLLVEDGELTFFSLLWLFRYASAAGHDVQSWLCDPDKLLPLDFGMPNHEPQPQLFTWGPIRSVDMLEKLGLVCVHAPNTPLEEKDNLNCHCRTTRRWQSFVEWLWRQQRILRRWHAIVLKRYGSRRVRRWFALPDSEGTVDLLPPVELNCCIEAYAPVLPVRRMEYDVELQQWLHSLIGFLLSHELSSYIRRVKPLCEFDNVRTFVRRCLRPRSRWFGRLVGSALGSHDQPMDGLVARLCRAGYFPLEYLMRCYQPYETHLLVMPYNYTPTAWLTHMQHPLAPTMIAFAMIIGPIPADAKYVITREVLPDIVSSAARPSRSRHGVAAAIRAASEWLDPYWTLLGQLSAAISSEYVESKKIAAVSDEAMVAQAHEASGMVELIAKSTPAVMLESVAAYFTTLFATTRKDITTKLQAYAREGLYPELFAAGDTIGKFSENALHVALHIEHTIALHRDMKTSELATITDKAARARLKNYVDTEMKTLWKNATGAMTASIDTSSAPGMPEARWFLFAGLVCAFRNALQHVKRVRREDKKRFDVMLGWPDAKCLEYPEPHGRRGVVIAITNSGYIDLLRKQEPKWHQGSTIRALRFHCGHFDSAKLADYVHKVSDLGQGYSVWRTLVPIPYQLMEQTDDDYPIISYRR